MVGERYSAQYLLPTFTINSSSPEREIEIRVTDIVASLYKNLSLKYIKFVDLEGWSDSDHQLYCIQFDGEWPDTLLDVHYRFLSLSDHHFLERKVEKVALEVIRHVIHFLEKERLKQQSEETTQTNTEVVSV